MNNLTCQIPDGKKKVKLEELTYFFLFIFLHIFFIIIDERWARIDLLGR